MTNRRETVNYSLSHNNVIKMCSLGILADNLSTQLPTYTDKHRDSETVSFLWLVFFCARSVMLLERLFAFFLLIALQILVSTSKSGLHAYISDKIRVVSLKSR